MWQDMLTKLQKDITPADIHDTIECAGTIFHRSIGSVNLMFWGLRLYFAGWSTVVVIWSFVRFCMKDCVGNWFTYLINWSLLLDTVYLWSIVSLHIQIYYYLKELKRSARRSRTPLTLADIPDIDIVGLRSLWNSCLILLNCSLSISVFQTIFYWTVTYEYETDDSDGVSFITWNVYGLIGTMMIFEFLTSTWQLSYYGALYLFGIVFAWVLLSIIFYAANGHNEYDGGRYIHGALDWGAEPGVAIGYSIALIVGIPLMHCWLVVIKSGILRIWLLTHNMSDRKGLIIDENDNEFLNQDENAYDQYDQPSKVIQKHPTIHIDDSINLDSKSNLLLYDSGDNNLLTIVTAKNEQINLLQQQLGQKTQQIDRLNNVIAHLQGQISTLQNGQSQDDDNSGGGTSGSSTTQDEN